MFVVEITFPSCSTSSLFKKTYRSLRHASIELKVSYYFLYNCYHHQHKNQFTRFFKIYRVDGNGDKLEYRSPKKKNKNNDLKQLVRNKPNSKLKKCNKSKTKIQLNRKKKIKEESHNEWVSNGEVNSEEHDTSEHVSKKTWCGHWKLWSFGN